MQHPSHASARRARWQILDPASLPGARRTGRHAPQDEPWLMRWAQLRQGIDAGDAERLLHPLPRAHWTGLLAPYAAWGQPEGSSMGLRDLEQAALRLADAVGQACRTGGKAIGISGDYDCDGNCATALMVRFFQQSGVPRSKLHVHVPNRKSDGYGVNKRAISDMDWQQVGTVVTVDNGTLAHAPLEDAVARGMHAVVIDHHPNSADHPLPRGAWVVNPKRADEPLCGEANGVADLAAVGVSWLVARRAVEILRQRGHYREQDLPVPDADGWLGLVALATVGDVVRMNRPLNRALVAEGLQRIREGGDPYLTALAEAARVPDVNRLSSTDIAFSMTPVVNAPGRLGQSVAWAFLTPENATANDLPGLMVSSREEVKQLQHGVAQAAATIARQPWLDASGRLHRRMQQLLAQNDAADSGLPGSAPGMVQQSLLMLSVQANDRRKLIETALVRQALPIARAMIGDDDENPQCETLMLAGEGWHEGVIGIVAGRLKEEFNMPVMVASIDPETGMCKASARSVRTPDESVNVGAFVRHACEKEGLMTKAGGHPMAAGCSFHRDAIAAIRARMEAALGPAARRARLSTARPLAAALNLAELSRDAHRSLPDIVERLVAAQAQAEPFGESADKPAFALYAARIGNLVTARNGRDLQFTVTPAIPLAGQNIAVQAFKSVGTRIEALLRDAQHQAEPVEYVLVGTFEAPQPPARELRFRLDDMIAVPLRGERPGMPQREAAVAAALGSTPGRLRTLIDPQREPLRG